MEDKKEIVADLYYSIQVLKSRVGFVHDNIYYLDKKIKETQKQADNITGLIREIEEMVKKLE